MRGHVYVVQGDITRCQADAIAFSTSTLLSGTGKQYSSFAKLDGFESAYAEMRRAKRKWCPGDTHWLPGSKGRPPIVACTSVDGKAEHTRPVELAAEIVRNVITCAVANLRKSESKNRRLVLLPAFLIGDGGVRRLRAELARAQVRAAWDTIGDMPGVDVGFVLFHPADHELFRAARRLAIPQLFDDVPAPHAALVDALRRRECALFVGSGLSVGAGMQGWDKLIDTLRASIADLEPTPSKKADDHLRVAQTYRDHTTSRSLTHVRDVVRSMFGATNTTLPTLAHFLMVGLNARNIFTTNYDHLIEDALAASRRECRKVFSADHVPQTSGIERVNVVKFHGDAEEGDEVVISKADYDRFFDERPAFDLLLSGLLLNHSFLFVGYGLQDPNFRHIYSRIARVLGAAQRPAFATTFEPPANASQDLARVEVTSFAAAPDKGQLFWRWLDQLVDVASNADTQLLAEAGDNTRVVSPHMLEVRETLLQLGSRVIDLAREELAKDDAVAVARIAQVLFERGWRARSGNHRILARLATRLDPQDREALLLAALAQTDSEAEVEELKKSLQAPQGSVGRRA